ncbi:hypothetical protein BV25DRAFT_1639587 [Artomyces pyxidatus]|uniref:Uncharacterized protein n=1 Tax=Artomyces pyxidatus TaxID=48021 RepID=A0ACB8SIU4_9AGAM|nr:hypothetical protein BV25DRAFT_1639587 [Artomyces pyxidatus]
MSRRTNSRSPSGGALQTEEGTSLEPTTSIPDFPVEEAVDSLGGRDEVVRSPLPFDGIPFDQEDQYQYWPRPESHYSGQPFTTGSNETRVTPPISPELTAVPRIDGGSIDEKFWSIYLAELKEKDRALIENMTADTNGVLVFTGLFGAIVAAFIIESYKLLQPDSGGTTVLLLAQISQQLAAGFNNTDLPSPLPIAGLTATFRPLPSSVRINVLWFLSLSLSITCALTATLMQQWARRYTNNTQNAERAGSPKRQGRIHAYLFTGLHTFRMASAVEALPALLHASVALFFAGLVDFLFTINTVVAYTTLACAIVGIVAYAVFTFLPFWFPNCPYATPFSYNKVASVMFYPLYRLCKVLERTMFPPGRLFWWQSVVERRPSSAWRMSPRVHTEALNAHASLDNLMQQLRDFIQYLLACAGVYFGRFLESMIHTLERQRDPGASNVLYLLDAAASSSDDLEVDALQWTWAASVEHDDDVFQVVDSIPGFIGNDNSFAFDWGRMPLERDIFYQFYPDLPTADEERAHKLIECLIRIPGFSHKISSLLSTTTGNARTSLASHERVRRATSLMHLVMCMTSMIRPLVSSLWPSILSPIIKELDKLRKDNHPDIAICANCTAASLVCYLDYVVRRLDWDSSNTIRTTGGGVPLLQEFTNCLKDLLPTTYLAFWLVGDDQPHATAAGRYTLTRAQNVAIFARGVLPHLHAASAESLILIRETLSSTPLAEPLFGRLWEESMSPEIKFECIYQDAGELQYLQTQLRRAAREEDAEFAGGAVPPWSAERLTSYTRHPCARLYEDLHPLFRWTNAMKERLFALQTADTDTQPLEGAQDGELQSPRISRASSSGPRDPDGSYRGPDAAVSKRGEKISDFSAGGYAWRPTYVWRRPMASF